MYIYNVTANIHESIHEEWTQWIKQHIQKTLNTRCFTSAKLTQVLVEEEMGGVTYSIQYRSPSKEHLQNYYKHHDAELKNESFKKFADKMLTFTTELKVIEEVFNSELN